MSFKYSGSGPMKAVFFFSGGASSMKAVLESPEHGKLYKVVGAVTNASAIEAGKGYGIAGDYEIGVEYVNPRNFETRRDFYARVGSAIKEMEADVIGLSGWVGNYSLITDPFLSEHQNRILNVHPARLSIIAFLEGKLPLALGTDEVKKRRRNLQGTFVLNEYYDGETITRLKPGWERLYTGEDAVTMAALFGEEEVCSTIFSADRGKDTGPILVQSKRLPVDTKYVDKLLGRSDFNKIVEYARYKLQSEMKTECDGPAFCTALGFLGQKRMGIFDDHADLDRGALPYSGFQME